MAPGRDPRTRTWPAVGTEQAEFAADLWQTYLGEGTEEYRDPVEFFRRTYLTESLKRMLAGAVQRLAGSGGDPVVQLQTNFGGGKTHSMLALYHLCSGAPPERFVRSRGSHAGCQGSGPAERQGAWFWSVTASRPAIPTPSRTAPSCGRYGVNSPWQLGGAEAYARVAKDDEHATSPGDVLRQLLVYHGPSLILIDEWVAYARQLHDQSDLPAGSFETQFTFAQGADRVGEAGGQLPPGGQPTRVRHHRLPRTPRPTTSKWAASGVAKRSTGCAT